MRHSEDELCANTQYNYDNHHFKDAKVLRNSIKDAKVKQHQPK